MDIEYFRGKLEEEKQKLESEMGGIARQNPRIQGDWELVPTEEETESDLADQADILVNRESALALLADLEARYTTVLTALARVEKGSYGTCDVCGKRITLSRLKANSAAITCANHLAR